MKSTIRIDVDHDNQPVIRVEYFPSDDVRDTLVKKFLEAFGGGCYARFFFRQSNDPQPINTTAYIRPINAFDLPNEQEFFNNEADAHRKMQDVLAKDRPIATGTTTNNITDELKFAPPPEGKTVTIPAKSRGKK